MPDKWVQILKKRIVRHFIIWPFVLLMGFAALAGWWHIYIVSFVLLMVSIALILESDDITDEKRRRFWREFYNR